VTLYWISLDVSVLVAKRVHVLFIFIYIYFHLCTCSGVQRTLCCVFVLFVFILQCTLCCQFLWIVLFWLPLLYSLMFITPPVVYLFVIFCFLHLRFGFFISFVLFCFIFRFVFYFVCFVLFCFFVCAFKRTLKIHVICRKMIWYLPIRNRLCIPTKVFWINKKLWYKTPISTFRILLSYMHIIIHGRLSFKAVTKIRTLIYWHVQINEQHYF
jgi:hypothetical protein